MPTFLRTPGSIHIFLHLFYTFNIFSLWQKEKNIRGENKKWDSPANNKGKWNLKSTQVFSTLVSISWVIASRSGINSNLRRVVLFLILYFQRFPLSFFLFHNIKSYSIVKVEQKNGKRKGRRRRIIIPQRNPAHTEHNEHQGERKVNPEEIRWGRYRLDWLSFILFHGIT